MSARVKAPRIIGKRIVAVLLVTLGGATGCQQAQPGLGSTDGNRPPRPSPPVEIETGALNVRLELLTRPVADIVRRETRSPFQFGEQEPEAPPPVPTAPPLAQARPSPADPRLAAPLRLQLIGFVQAERRAERIAVLSDGEIVLYGQTGEIVDGRYRILQVGETSVEIEGIEDGRRHILRLAGS